MNIVFCVIAAFLSVVGASYLILSLLYHCTKIKDDNVAVLIIPDIEKNTDPEFLIRSITAKANCMRRCKFDNIVCVDNGLSEKTKKELQILSKDYEYLTVLTKEELIKKAGQL